MSVVKEQAKSSAEAGLIRNSKNHARVRKDSRWFAFGVGAASV